MPDENQYYLLVDNEAHGPFSRAQLVEGLMAGEIPKKTLVATMENQEWVPIENMIQMAEVDPSAMKFTETIKLQLPENEG